MPCNCLPGNQFIIESRFLVLIFIPVSPQIYPSTFVCARHSPKPGLALFQTFPYTNTDSIPERMKATHSATNKKPCRYPYSKNENMLAVNLPLEKINKRLQKLGHRSRQHCNIGVSETFIMTNKGAALKYEHICSRDLDSRLSWLRVLLQPSSTSQTHCKSRICTISRNLSLQLAPLLSLEVVLKPILKNQFVLAYWLHFYITGTSDKRLLV